uniref:Chloride channel protein n=1 Tax=Ganoderma boninense TaxID=34458 RepID=A0A5K1K027_9APHY|nr:Chloride channel protein [Ganoderma boninense]
MLSFSAPIKAVPFFRAKPRPVHPKRHLMLIRSASEIQPRLWLSGLYTAVDEEQLVAIGVTHIVSILEQRPKYPAALKKKLKTLHIPLQDIDTADLLQHFDATTAFIKSALDDKRNTVLVHCAMGISRSATVVSAYLIATASMQPHEAVEFVQSKREIVCPNLGFRRQLDAYASRLRGSKKLRKPVAPPVRATVSYKTGWRWFLPPEHEGSARALRPLIPLLARLLLRALFSLLTRHYLLPLIAPIAPCLLIRLPHPPLLPRWCVRVRGQARWAEPGPPV